MQLNQFSACEKAGIRKLKRNSLIQVGHLKLTLKYVQSWKAAHLPTLEIQVEQRGNRVKKGEKSEFYGF